MTGTVFILSRNGLKWHVFYIGTHDGYDKYTYYTNPQPGEQFDVDSSMIKEYDTINCYYCPTNIYREINGYL